MPVWAPMFLRNSAKVMNTTGSAGRRWVEKCLFKCEKRTHTGSPAGPTRYGIQPKLACSVGVFNRSCHPEIPALQRD